MAAQKINKASCFEGKATKCRSAFDENAQTPVMGAYFEEPRDVIIVREDGPNV